MKLLMGGSPCTYWSIAQTKNRETEPSGIGWELFKNYLIALEKFKPDYFLYENNKSMSQAIREEITKRFGFEPICINSAKVSAQNRQRLYWVGKRNPDGTYSWVDVQQPEDRGILLRDILETGVAWREKGYCLAANRGGHCLEHDLKYGKNNYAAEPVGVGYRNMVGNTVDRKTCVAEPVRVGTYPTAKGESVNSQSKRIYSVNGKACSICASGAGGNSDTGSPATGLYAVSCAGRMVGRRINEGGHRDDYNTDIPHIQRFEINENPQKTNCLTTVEKDNMIIQVADGKTFPIYEVRNGLIAIKGKQYPIKLADGCYIIRKLTVTECKRLQTVPDDYVFPVSDTQAYKMLGNGWTVDVICHILSHCDGLTAEPLDVLSMYDGMACGHIALDKLGAKIQRYRATEIDKYAIKTACHNFPDIEQLGDAFQVRKENWK